MKWISKKVVFQEVPGEVSLSYLISWCPWRCEWCHSPEARNPQLWTEFTEEQLKKDIYDNRWFITCVLFLWGDWNSIELLRLMEIVKEENLKVALYSWREDVAPEIRNAVDYLKLGPYKKELGGLGSKKTNQRMFDRSWQDITHLFRKNKN